MCPICESCLWGLIGFHALDYLFGVHLPYRLLIPYILCLCGLQTIISKAVSKYRIIEEFDTEAFRQLFDLNEKSPAKKVYDNIELPLIPVLEAAEEKGIKVDVDYLKKLALLLAKEKNLPLKFFLHSHALTID